MFFQTVYLNLVAGWLSFYNYFIFILLMLRFHNITSCDVNNGEGFRVTLWVAGCSHHCKGCQNEQTWSFTGGRPFTDADKQYLFSELSKSYVQGLTLSGGDPLDSFSDVIALVREVRDAFPAKDIWLYTGYTMEQIEDGNMAEILPLLDVVVDGPYIEEQRDVTLAFRGSRNQRIIKLKSKKVKR